MILWKTVIEDTYHSNYPVIIFQHSILCCISIHAKAASLSWSGQNTFCLKYIENTLVENALMAKQAEEKVTSNKGVKCAF